MTIKFTDTKITLSGDILQDIWDSLVNKPNRESDWSPHDKLMAFQYLDLIVSMGKRAGVKAAAEAATKPPAKSVDEIVAAALEATGMTINGGTVDDPLDDENEEGEEDDSDEDQPSA